MGEVRLGRRLRSVASGRICAAMLFVATSACEPGDAGTDGSGDAASTTSEESTITAGAATADVGGAAGQAAHGAGDWGGGGSTDPAGDSDGGGTSSGSSGRGESGAASTDDGGDGAGSSGSGSGSNSTDPAGDSDGGGTSSGSSGGGESGAATTDAGGANSDSSGGAGSGGTGNADSTGSGGSGGSGSADSNGSGGAGGANGGAGGGSSRGPWVADSSVVASRTGFASDLPEFKGNPCPEQKDPAEVVIAFEPGQPTGTIEIGAPVHLEAGLTGTFAGGNLSATGAAGGFAIDLVASHVGDALTGTVTVTNGAHEEVRSFVATPGEDSLRISEAYWVDSENGDDANDGSTPDRALASIGALPALQGDDVIRLARGSRWREHLAGPAAKITVENYGVGPRPIVDAFDPTLASGWTKTAGWTNIYQHSLTAESPGGSSYTVTVLEAGRQLHPVADQAACDTTPGSYVAVNPSGGGAVTVYVHPLDSTAPDDQEIELTWRPHGVLVVGASTVRGIMLRGGWHTSGALYVDASSSAIDDAIVDDCVALHGTDHNLYMPGGTLSRSIVLGVDGGPNAASAIVFHRQTIDAAAEMTIDDVGVINFPDVDGQMPLSQKPVAFNSHATSGTWAKQTLIRTGSSRMAGWAISRGVVDQCLFENPRAHNRAMVGQVTATHPIEVRNSRFYGMNSGTNGQAIQHGGALLVENVLSVRDGDTITGGHIFANGVVVVRNSLFVKGGAEPVNDLSDALSCTFERNVCLDRGPRLGTQGSVLSPSDYNVAGETTMWRENSSAASRAFATYRDSNAYGNDTNSTTTLPEYELEADPTRPEYMETRASLTARGWDAGPAQGRPGSGLSWVTPPTYNAWKMFVDAL